MTIDIWQSKALILLYVGMRQHCEMVIRETERLVKIKLPPYEIMEFDIFMRRWGSYDWQSDAFKRTFTRRYRSVSICGSLTEDDLARYLELADALGWQRSFRKQEPTP